MVACSLVAPPFHPTWLVDLLELIGKQKQWLARHGKLGRGIPDARKGLVLVGHWKNAMCRMDDITMVRKPGRGVYKRAD